MDPSRLTDILKDAERGHPLSQSRIVDLLSLTSPFDIRRVMKAARKVRQQNFGNAIFLYGFVYVSTHCRNDCRFCFYRSSNPQSPRYRRTLDQVTDAAKVLADTGVHLIDLTFGEDPMMGGNHGFSAIIEMISEVKAATGKPIMISPGVVPDRIILRMAECGADWFALYQETHDRKMYRALRVGQDYHERCEKRRTAARANMLVEDGMLIGVGEKAPDRARSVSAMRNADTDQVRVMSFVPQLGTPMANLVPIRRDIEYLTIAVMRLAMPDRLIPASLDVDGIQGLAPRLAAGANVVTSIIPPAASLAGVSQSYMDIEEGMRGVTAVKQVLRSMNLVIADDRSYTDWMAHRRMDPSQPMKNAGAWQ